MEFEYVGQVNGQPFKRVVLLPSAMEAYDQKRQPPLSVIKQVFVEDILPTLSQYNVATSFDEKHQAQVMHAVSCTANQIGFSTGHRDTIFKIENETLIVFHHKMRRENQYQALMKKYYSFTQI